MLSSAEIWIFWARRYDFWQTLGSWTWITWLTFGKRCLTTETRGTGAMAGNRPEQPLGLMVGTSELFAKADFGTLAVVDDGSDIRNRVPGSTFGGE